MAEGIEEVTAAFQALQKGEGDFDAVLRAVEAATFDARPIHRLGDPPEYVRVPGSFEDAVTPWHVRKVIDREQWKQLRDLWKAKTMPKLEG